MEPEFQSLRADKTVVLMPLTDNIVKCYCKIFPTPNSIFLTAEKEKLKSNTNFIVGRSLIKPNFSNGIYIRILNPTNSKITIHEHEVIAKMKKIDFPKSVHTVKMGNRAEQSNSKREKSAKPIMQDKNVENSASERKKSYKCDGCALCHH